VVKAGAAGRLNPAQPGAHAAPSPLGGVVAAGDAHPKPLAPDNLPGPGAERLAPDCTSRWCPTRGLSSTPAAGSIGGSSFSAGRVSISEPPSGVPWDHYRPPPEAFRDASNTSAVSISAHPQGDGYSPTCSTFLSTLLSLAAFGDASGQQYVYPSPSFPRGSHEGADRDHPAVTALRRRGTCHAPFTVRRCQPLVIAGASSRPRRPAVVGWAIVDDARRSLSYVDLGVGAALVDALDRGRPATGAPGSAVPRLLPSWDVRSGLG